MHVVRRPRLQIRNLHVVVEDREIVRGLDLTVYPGELHAIMGPNGSGKSTLALALMGHPKYQVTEGEVWLDGQNVLEMKPHQRAMAGMFLAFQYPQEIQGVPMGRFLWTALTTRRKAGADGSPAPRDLLGFGRFLRERLEAVRLNPDFAQRHLNVGFSGGEKKRAEVVQMMVFRPKMALLDEIDSGLDIDSVRIVAEAIQAQRDGDMSILIITHYPRILHYLEPDYVHVMVDGRIVHTGDKSLALRLEELGYEGFLRELLPELPTPSESSPAGPA